MASNYCSYQGQLKKTFGFVTLTFNRCSKLLNTIRYLLIRSDTFVADQMNKTTIKFTFEGAKLSIIQVKISFANHLFRVIASGNRRSSCNHRRALKISANIE